MKIGIIGLGDIAQKAYLPVITAREDIEIVLCTRNADTLHALSNKYRITQRVTQVEDLIALNINAAFVHTATESHGIIVRQLLEAGVHVYVDKPIAYTLEESRALVELAEARNLILMVGFNRRFAPLVAEMKEKEPRRLIFLQKNRLHHPDFARRFVMDDFIHVVDTLRFLASGPIHSVKVTSYIEGGQLYHVMLQLDGESFSVVGSMNRDSGTAEEILEVMTPGNKWITQNLNTAIHMQDGKEVHLGFKDWDPILYRRGFHQIIEEFISSVKENRKPSVTAQDALETHKLCEQVLGQLYAQGAATWKEAE
ncbi:virulence factor [Paenibacillus shirakamiensis]|uniref:Virulence factor n=1 Tax=Paenibacillus shirakamiensis TaxID=1265935 RepID=A0ABS4JGT5_9BACL|nr:Gfo/Idh/MocA family oxidoreductase [Paenibacillus shirakamiensis]MBP2000930.1 virulence factor [Paenibacillus shirakamiensis]